MYGSGLTGSARNDVFRKLNEPPARACAREAPGYSLNSRDFRRARSPQARLTECFHMYRLHTKKRPSVARHKRCVACHVDRPRVRSKKVYIAEPAPELQPMCCEIGAPRREIRPDWTTTRSRAGGAGAIETPTPGAVPDFIPVVWRYRTTATWRLSFHCGMNAADTSAWRGIRIGCVSEPRRDAVRTSPRSWPGTMRRLRTGLILGFGLRRWFVLDRLPVLGQPLPSAREPP